jgi:hypothetical protein
LSVQVELAQNLSEQPPGVALDSNRGIGLPATLVIDESQPIPCNVSSRFLGTVPTLTGSLKQMQSMRL